MLITLLVTFLLLKELPLLRKIERRMMELDLPALLKLKSLEVPSPKFLMLRRRTPKQEMINLLSFNLK